MDPTALARRFDRLCSLAHDTTVVFGSGRHDWIRQPPLAASTLADIEAELGPLPEPARRWFAEVSGGGAGPNYGLLPPRRPVAGDPRASFPISTPRRGAQALDGALPISDEGAGITTVLVLTGPQRGEVWSVHPKGSRARVAPDFASWMSAWIDQAVIQWGERHLGEALAQGLVLDDAASLAEVTKAVVDAQGEAAREGPLAVLCWLRCMEGRFDEALPLASAAALAFVDRNAVDDETIERAGRERVARGHLYRGRVLRLAGRVDDARRELEAGAAIHGIWATTRDALPEELRRCGAPTD